MYVNIFKYQGICNLLLRFYEIYGPGELATIVRESYVRGDPENAGH